MSAQSPFIFINNSSLVARQQPRFLQSPEDVRKRLDVNKAIEAVAKIAQTDDADDRLEKVVEKAEQGKYPEDVGKLAQKVLEGGNVSKTLVKEIAEVTPEIEGCTCKGPAKCSKPDNTCVGFDGEKVYCYGKDDGCIPNDCATDADCSKYDPGSPKFFKDHGMKTSKGATSPVSCKSMPGQGCMMLIQGQDPCGPAADGSYPAYCFFHDACSCSTSDEQRETTGQDAMIKVQDQAEQIGGDQEQVRDAMDDLDDIFGSS